jgi:hypothetical protein
MQLVVVDDSLANNPDIFSENPTGLSVTIFRNSPESFPPIKSLGTIVQFRHFRIQIHQGTLQAISTRWAAWTVFEQEGPNAWRSNPPTLIHDSELEAAERIHAFFAAGPQAHKTRALPQPGSGAEPSLATKRPFVTVSEVRPRSFFKGVFKIAKFSLPSSHSGEQLTMLVTDFTENELLSSTPEAINLPGYLAKCLLPVTLWDNFASQAVKLSFQAGDYIYLDNLAGKMVRHDDGTANIMAVLHGAEGVDESYFVQLAARAGALPSSNPHVKRIEDQHARLRQLKEFSAAGSQIAAAAEERNTVIGYEAEGAIVRVSKTEPFGKAIPSSPAKSSPTKPQQSPGTPSRARTVPVPVPVSKPDPFVTTRVGDRIAITTTLAARSYPEELAKFCIKGKVVAMFPVNIYNTVRFVCGVCSASMELLDYRNGKRVCSKCQNRGHERDRFIWVFGLVLEDPTGDLTVILADEDAEEFLGVAAADITRTENFPLLERLQRTLEELVDSRNRPVDDPTREHLFCIQSYRILGQDPQHLISGMRYRVCSTRMY